MELSLRKILLHTCIIFAFFGGVEASSSIDLTELANRYKSDKGNQHFHAHNYTQVYEQLFAPMREKPIRLLEIGLNLAYRHDCASLHMWLDYFPNAWIYGIDIEPQSFQHPRLKILQGNQGDPIFLTSCRTAFPDGLDIIIDDGSHEALHQQTSLLCLWGMLNPGGIYIIEDLHYQPPQSDQVNRTRILLENLKNGQTISIPGFDGQVINEWIDSIESIEFFHSASFGEKSGAIIRKIR